MLNKEVNMNQKNLSVIMYNKYGISLSGFDLIPIGYTKAYNVKLNLIKEGCYIDITIKNINNIDSMFKKLDKVFKIEEID